MAGRPGNARIFAALGDEARLHLVTRLCDQGPMSISRLTAGTRVTRQAITKHCGSWRPRVWCAAAAAAARAFGNWTDAAWNRPATTSN